MQPHRALVLNASLCALLSWQAAWPGEAQAAEPGPIESQWPLPAVSGLNTKFGVFGSDTGNVWSGGGFGAVALPLAPGYGLQLDGVVGRGDNAPFYGGGAHLFWRDPARALLGLYVSDLRWDAGSIDGATAVRGTEVGKAGVEAHLYSGRFTLEGLAAYQFGTGYGFAGKATAAYYLNDDFRLHVTATRLEGPGWAASTGFEWAPVSGSRASLFADVGITEDHDVRSLVGLKLYFSRDDKTLIRRHREDDPDVDLPADLFQTIRTAPPVAASSPRPP